MYYLFNLKFDEVKNIKYSILNTSNCFYNLILSDYRFFVNFQDKDGKTEIQQNGTQTNIKPSDRQTKMDIATDRIT